MKWRKHPHSKLKGLAAGAIGGLVASWVMNHVPAVFGTPQPQQGGESSGLAAQRQGRRQQQGAGEDPTVRTAVVVAESIFHVELPEDRKKAAGSVVHSAYGAALGAPYGLTVEEWRAARSGEGAVFGAAVWLGSDEIAVPALKLAKSPRAYPLKVHANALASHVVYGVTTELVRRGLRAGVLAR
jgi:hypothetical protein